MEPQQSGVRTWQWVVTAIVIIVLIIIGIMVFGGRSTNEPGTNGTSTATSTGTTGNEVNRIVMSDQYPGNVVYLSSVQLERGGWVVIHKDNRGQPGDVIGSTYFNPGINPGRVNLTQSTTEGGIYYAVLHTDDGDKVFNASRDAALKDARGNIIMKLFRAAASVGAEFKG
jgi:hypothetical protein